MTTSMRDHELTLPPPEARDKLGGYVQKRLDVSTGHKLALYEWEPECGAAAARGVLFLLHGVLAHTKFEFLASDADNHRTLLHGSMIERLVANDVFIVGHDHPGHGRSTGLHAYVDSHDELRDAAIDVVEHYTRPGGLLHGKPKCVLGVSMGGTVAIRMCDKRPDLIDHYALVVPAVRPPDDMFGLYGHFLKLISPILGATVPKLPVLKLPPSDDPVVRDAVEKDGLMYRGALRVRMGIEFLRVYEEVNARADELTFGSVAIFVGGRDQIVSPEGIKQFVARVSSDDKDMLVFDDLTHDLLREPGCEPVIDQLNQWILDRF